MCMYPVYIFISEYYDILTSEGIQITTQSVTTRHDPRRAQRAVAHPLGGPQEGSLHVAPV